jgi:hypothetical protein
MNVPVVMEAIGRAAIVQFLSALSEPERLARLRVTAAGQAMVNR